MANFLALNPKQLTQVLVCPLSVSSLTHTLALVPSTVLMRNESSILGVVRFLTRAGSNERIRSLFFFQANTLSLFSETG